MKQKHERLIILDFDHTLFNTTKFVAAEAATLETAYGIPKETFMQVREEVKQCCTVIDIDTFVEKLPHDDKAGMHEAIHKTAVQSAKWIFDDVRPFLRSHLDQFDVLILTHGDQELQQEKITHANLPEGFSYIISTEAKVSIVQEYIGTYDEIYMIEDKAKNLEAVKKQFPTIHAYFIVRKEDHPYSDACLTCSIADKTIHNLSFSIQ